MLEPPPPQYVLCAERDQNRVLGVVIKGIAAGYALDDEAGRLISPEAI